jgi:hypothetical protein
MQECAGMKRRDAPQISADHKTRRSVSAERPDYGRRCNFDEVIN